MNSWARSACYPRSTFYPLSDGASTRHRQITKTRFRVCPAWLGPRLRQWCSSRYLQISPLHREFRSRLLDSSPKVPGDPHRLGLWISRRAFGAACAPFTPNDSEQRSPPTCYRGCWHVVSRGLFPRSRHPAPIPWRGTSPRGKGLYNLTASIVHAASLRQAFAHCGRSLAAASRRSLGRSQSQCGRPPSQAGYPSSPRWAFTPPSS